MHYISKMKKLYISYILLSFCLGIAQEKSPNIILMIGDGMGLTQISSGMYANNNSTALEKFQYIGLSKTYSSDQLVTDSAASGTAMATGHKTFNGAVGVDRNSNPQKSILELCNSFGYSTALIATSSIVHATPASFYAKVPSRRQYEEIALQLSNSNVDLFVGGGKKYFDKREDKKNLINEMKAYQIVNSLKKFEQSKSSKVGFFTYDDEPPYLLDGRTPELEKITAVALEKLASKKAPFFMMIEGSQIDWGGHDNKMINVVSEFQEFDRTIKTVLEFAQKQGNTLVIVTADHETGGLSLFEDSTDKGKVKGLFNTAGHTATMVPVFSFGPHAEMFKGIYENTAIFDKMAKVVFQ